MSATIASPATARPAVGIQFGEIVRVTRHQHNQHSWRNPFERRRETSLPEDLALERPANPPSPFGRDSQLEPAEAAAREA